MPKPYEKAITKVMYRGFYAQEVNMVLMGAEPHVLNWILPIVVFFVFYLIAK